jgi:hypothetical protein
VADRRKKTLSQVGEIRRRRAASIAARHRRPPSNGRMGSRLNSALAKENPAISRKLSTPKESIWLCAQVLQIAQVTMLSEAANIRFEIGPAA